MNNKSEHLKQEIEKILVVIRKQLAVHRGDVELVDVDADSGKVSVRLKGMCVGCPMSELTLKAGIEGTLKQLLPDIKEVVNVA